MAPTFHTGARITQTFRAQAAEDADCCDNCKIVAELIASADTPFTPDDADALSMMSKTSLKRVLNRYLSKKPRVQEEYARPATRTNAQRESDRREAEAFLPESTLVAHRRKQGRDTAPVIATLRERAARARSAVAAAARAARPPAGGIALTAQERAQAADFAPPSTLDAWRSREAR
jgi:hypothetical protein